MEPLYRSTTVSIGGVPLAKREKEKSRGYYPIRLEDEFRRLTNACKATRLGTFSGVNNC